MYSLNYSEKEITEKEEELKEKMTRLNDILETMKELSTAKIQKIMERKEYRVHKTKTLVEPIKEGKEK